MAARKWRMTNGEFLIRNSQFAIRNSQFAIRNSQFAIPNSLLLLAGLLYGCTLSTRPIAKIGLVAPFEGRYRDVGYEVIYAVRLAVREANRAGGVAGYGVELVAFDDGGDPDSAVWQARKLAADPLVVGALGHFLDATTLAAAPEYVRNGIAFLATTSSEDLPSTALRLFPTEQSLNSAAPDAASLRCAYPCGALDDLDWLIEARAHDAGTLIYGPPLWEQTQFTSLAGAAAEGVYVLAPAPLPADAPGGEQFAEDYRANSNGVEPKSFAVLAYDATRFLFTAIEQDVAAHAQPTRAGVAGAVRQTAYTGLSGEIEFGSDGSRPGAGIWVYRWRDGQLTKP